MLKKITELIREYKGDDELIVTEASSIQELGLDSLDMAELIMNIEDELNITIEMNQTIKSVSDLVKIIENSK